MPTKSESHREIVSSALLAPKSSLSGNFCIMIYVKIIACRRVWKKVVLTVQSLQYRIAHWRAMGKDSEGGDWEGARLSLVGS